MSFNKSNQFQSRSLLTATLPLVLFIFGCAEERSIPLTQQVVQAPTSQKEVGVVASDVTQEEVLSILAANADAQVRIVNPVHGIYEFHNISQTDLRAQLPNAAVAIEKNHYTELSDLKLNAKAVTANPIADMHPFVIYILQNQGVFLDGPMLEFVNTCDANIENTPTVNFSTNITGSQRTGLVVDVNKSLLIKASQPANQPTRGNLEYLWLTAGPEDSARPYVASKNEILQFQTETSGAHIFSIITKDAKKKCSLDFGQFYVKQNEPYRPALALKDAAANALSQVDFWHLFLVGSTNAWTTAKGANITIGIIDTGVDYNHAALTKNMAINIKEIRDNGIDDDRNGFVDDFLGYDFGFNDSSPYDEFGHGTHVAGIAASNAWGAAGQAKILATRFGAGLGMDAASVAGAIRYSVDRGAKILNMSFGGETDVALIKNAILYTEKKNVLVVAAAGNETANNDVTPSFPCNYKTSNMVSVAATDENNELTKYSNYGTNVHIAAPGGTDKKPIVSAARKNAKNLQRVGLMGTSMASPLVAGVAAQVWSANPKLTAAQVKQILLSTGTFSSKLTGKVASSRVVNAAEAVKKALKSRLP